MNKSTPFQTRAQSVRKVLYFAALVLIVDLACARPASAQNCTPVRPNLVSWWPGEGNALDFRSRNHGSLLGAAGFAAGQVGQAFNFSNVGDRVVIPDAPDLNVSGSFTAEAWIFPRSFPNAGPRIFDKDNALASRWILAITNAGALVAVITSGNNVEVAAVTANDAIPLNLWSHVAFTYSRGTSDADSILTVFINAAPLVSANKRIEVQVNTVPLRLGNDDGSGAPRNYDGLIDEPAVYNRALSQSEIQAIVNAGTAGKCKPTATVAPSSLVSWWSGDGHVNDIVGGNSPSQITGSPQFDVARVGQGVRFDGNSGLIVSDNPTLNFGTSSFSLEMWTRIDTFPAASGAVLFEKRNNLGQGYVLSMDNTGFFFTVRGNSGAVTVQTPPVSVGGFHHLAIAVDRATSNNVTFYLDGIVQSVSPSIAGIGNTDNSNRLFIGRNSTESGTTAGAFNGVIDELSLYNRALTPAEVTSLLNAGLAGKLKTGTTASGSNITTNVGGDVTITFPTVTTAGSTQQIPLSLTGLPSLPAGFTPTGLAYDIATAAAASGNVNIRFHLPCFSMLSQFSFLKVLHQEGGVFVDRTVGVDFASRTLSASVSSLSPFVIATGSSPTAVTLGWFAATGYDKGVMLEWRTGYESDNVGFRLYRENVGQRTLLSPQLIAGSALTAGSTLLAGQSYAWWDIGIVDCGSRIENCKNVAYWLEDVDLKGQSTWHGPFLVQQGKGAPPTRSQAALLSALGKTQADSTRPVEMTASATKASAEEVRLQTSLAAEPGIKISVKHEGWYRVTQPELAAAGFDTRVNPRLLQVIVDGNQLPILVQGEQDGSFDAGDSVEFYGIGVDSPFTGSRVYWLVAGGQFGLRINQAKSEGAPSPSGSFTYTVERRDRNIYFSGLRNGEKENFFGAVVGHNPVDQELTLLHLAQEDSAQAQLRIALQGVTFGDHHVSIRLNGLPVGELTFHGQTQGSARFAVANSILREGVNTVMLTGLSGESDISLVDYLRVSYQHSYTADNDALKLTATGNRLVAIDGFTSKYIRVFDVTDPNSPEEILGKVKQEKSGYTLTFGSPGQGQRELIAFATERRPARLSLNVASNLRAGSADFIFVTRRAFADALRPLVTLRQKQGLSVSLVDIEDIYDEFSFGQKNPYAVRDFLSYAKSIWKKKPRFVLFAGDASFDPKNYLGFGDSDLVPTSLIDTDFMETSSDDWLSDFNGDGIADIATGRLPARTVEELTRMVVKIVNYEQGAPSDEALLVADANDGFDFEQASAELRSLIPGSLRITQVNRGRVDPESARNSLFEALYRRQILVNYAGHGSVNLWSGNLLTNTDARELSNDHLPIFVMMTCLNGYFHDPALDSLGESLIKAERGGAVAVWASSGMTMPTDQALINKELYRLLFNRDSAVTLGEAVMRAKSSPVSADVRRTWILLGDPAMRLK